MPKSKVIIRETPSENILSKKEYKEANIEQIEKDYLQPKQIEELMLMKKSKVNTLIKNGTLKSRKFYNKVYVQRKSLFEYLKRCN